MPILYIHNYDTGAQILCTATGAQLLCTATGAQLLGHSYCAQLLVHSYCAQLLVHSYCAQLLVHSYWCTATVHSYWGTATGAQLLCTATGAQILVHSYWCTATGAQLLVHRYCAQILMLLYSFHAQCCPSQPKPQGQRSSLTPSQRWCTLGRSCDCWCWRWVQGNSRTSGSWTASACHTALLGNWWCPVPPTPLTVLIPAASATRQGGACSATLHVSLWCPRSLPTPRLHSCLSHLPLLTWASRAMAPLNTP